MTSSIDKAKVIVSKLKHQLLVADSPPANSSNGLCCSSSRYLAASNQSEAGQLGHLAMIQLCDVALNEGLLKPAATESVTEDLHNSSLDSEELSETDNWSEDVLGEEEEGGCSGEKKSSAESAANLNDRVTCNSPLQIDYDKIQPQDTDSMTGTTAFASQKLQLFGSEYARYCSNSPLSPVKSVKKNKGRQMIRRIRKAKNSSSEQQRHYSVQNAPIIDVVTIPKGKPPPKGYITINNNTSSKIDHILCVRKEVNWDLAVQRPLVTALCVILPDRGEFVPPGYSVVRTFIQNTSSINSPQRHIKLLSRGKPPTSSHNSSSSHSSSHGQPTNLNANKHGERVYLCFRRSREGNPLTSICLLYPPEAIPEGYTCMERTPFHFLANLNADMKHPPVFIAFRQRLANLELLRPVSLLIGHYKSRKNKLAAYYCSGGTAAKSVPSQYHMMDRTTHPMLSPSSVQTRMAVRQISIQPSSSFGSVDESPEASNKKLLLDMSNQGLSSGSYSPRSDAQTVTSMHTASSRGSTVPDIHRKGEVVTTPYLRIYCEDVMRHIPEIVDSSSRLADPSRIEVMVPILTACYCHHGGSSMLAVEGLIELLLHTDFFMVDERIPSTGNDSLEEANGITLLDLSIQVVCDVAMMGQETHFQPCITFISHAFYYGRGLLNVRSLGCILRCYLFICNFEASINQQEPSSSKIVGSTSEVESLAAIGLKDMISIILKNVENLPFSSSESKQKKSWRKRFIDESIESMVRSIVEDVVEESVTRGDLAEYTQLALAQIQRSGGSEIFWHDMTTSCGAALFGFKHYNHVVAFSVFSSLTKVAMSKIRTVQTTSTAVPRDKASKLLSFELLHHFLEYCGPNFRDSKMFGFQVRRLMASCLMHNTSEAFHDVRLFEWVLQILTLLWVKFRNHMKVELAVLFEHFLLQPLKMDAQIVQRVDHKDDDELLYFDHQCQILLQLMRWFEAPFCIVEIYLNYDLDSKGGQQWQFCQQLCSSLCALARQASDVQSKYASTSVVNQSSQILGRARHFQEQALLCMYYISRSLMDSCARLFLPSGRASPTKNKNIQHHEDSDDESTGNDHHIPATNDSPLMRKLKGKSPVKEVIIDHKGSKTLSKESLEDKQSEKEKSSALLNSAFDLAEAKGIKKALEYLFKCDFLSSSPREVASFLRFHRGRFDIDALGDYLGEGGVVPDEEEYWNSIRYFYVRAISFEGMNVEQSLRHFLTNSGFRLPGEAQRVDRIISTFARCFWEDNAGDILRCPFNNQDTVYLLAFAIIMLNTDLHRANNIKSKKKMSKQQFVNNLRGVDSDGDLAADYMETIYDSIEMYPIEMNKPTKSVANSLLKRSTDDEAKVTIENIQKEVKPALELLRGLSLFDHEFYRVDDKNLPTAEILKLIASETYPYFYGIINSTLDTAVADSSSLVACLDVLRYALSSTVLLKMEKERRAFALQLARIVFIMEKGLLNDVVDPMQRHRMTVNFLATNQEYTNEHWYQLLEASGKVDDLRASVDAIGNVHTIVRDIKNSMEENISRSRNIKKAVSRIRGGAYLLNDPNRIFMKEGAVVKKGPSGKNVARHLFLFSDRLVYTTAPSSLDGDFKINGDLLLTTIKVSDFDNTNNHQGARHQPVDNCFKIEHPRKSFLVFVQNQDEKIYWLQAIQNAISHAQLEYEV